MDFKEFLKKYQLVLILSFIVISLFIIKLVYGYKGEETIAPSTVLPTPTVEAVAPTITKEATETGKIKSLLPYSTKNFVVEGYDENNLTFKIKLLSKDKEAVIQEVVQWIQSNGLNPLDYQATISN